MATKKTPAKKKPAPTEEDHGHLGHFLSVLKGLTITAAALAPIVSRPFADAEDQAKVVAGAGLAAEVLGKIPGR